MTATAVTIAALEDGVVARLRAVVPPTSAAVDVFPDKPESYQLKHQVAELLVAYTGAQHSKFATSDSATVRTFGIEVAIVARGIGQKGHRVGTNLVELTLGALAGLVILGFDPLDPQQETFVARAEGTWVFTVRFQTATMCVPITDDSALGPLLARITLDQGSETTEIPES
jgi:hypothetical protein